MGIQFCGSGNGINMSANKHQGVRSALCWQEDIAQLARLHNNANICTMPARFISLEKALKIIDDSLGGSKLVTYITESSREVTPIGRQNYQTAYFRANIIAFRTKVLYETHSLTGDLVRYHIIPQERAVDIDNLILSPLYSLLL